MKPEGNIFKWLLYGSIALLFVLSAIAGLLPVVLLGWAFLVLVSGGFILHAGHVSQSALSNAEDTTPPPHDVKGVYLLSFTWGQKVGFGLTAVALLLFGVIVFVRQTQSMFTDFETDSVSLVFDALVYVFAISALWLGALVVRTGFASIAYNEEWVKFVSGFGRSRQKHWADLVSAKSSVFLGRAIFRFSDGDKLTVPFQMEGCGHLIALANRKLTDA